MSTNTVTSLKVIDKDTVINLAAEAQFAADLAAEIAADLGEQFSSDIKLAVARMHQSRKKSEMILSLEDVTDPTEPHILEMEGPEIGQWTINLFIHCDLGYVQAPLVLAHAKKLHRELGEAIKDREVELPGGMNRLEDN